MAPPAACATAPELGNAGNLTTYLPRNQVTVQNFYDYWAAKVQAENNIVNGVN